MKCCFKRNQNHVTNKHWLFTILIWMCNYCDLNFLYIDCFCFLPYVSLFLLFFHFHFLSIVEIVQVSRQGTIWFAWLWSRIFVFFFRFPSIDLNFAFNIRLCCKFVPVGDTVRVIFFRICIQIFSFHLYLTITWIFVYRSIYES